MILNLKNKDRATARQIELCEYINAHGLTQSSKDPRLMTFHEAEDFIREEEELREARHLAFILAHKINND